MSGIRNWLDHDRLPADLYELLGRPTFDPDRQGLLSAVRAAYGELLPYENHQDGKVARRATQLLRELGRAEDLLTDAEKLDRHHEAIRDRLRGASIRRLQEPSAPVSAE